MSDQSWAFLHCSVSDWGCRRRSFQSCPCSRFSSVGCSSGTGSTGRHCVILSWSVIIHPLTNVKWHSVTWPYTMTTPYWSDFVPTRPFTEFWVVSIEHLRRVWHADRGRLLLRTPGPVSLGRAYVLLVETNPYPNLSLFFPTMLFEYPSVLTRFCHSPCNHAQHTLVTGHKTIGVLFTPQRKRNPTTLNRLLWLSLGAKTSHYPRIFSIRGDITIRWLMCIVVCIKD